MSCTVVFDETGRCKYVLEGDASVADLSSEAAVVQSETAVDPNKVWYDHEVSEMRARTPFVVSVTVNKIEHIPFGTLLNVKNESTVVESGEIEFEVDYPETLRVLLRHVRHLDTTVEVPCEAQG
jgi:hypothetical protein